MRRVGSCLLGVGLLLAGCGRPAMVGKPLRVGVQDNTVCALVFLAQGKGYFADEGLAVELVPFASGKVALDMMLSGDVDVSASADMPTMSHSFDRADYALFCTIARTDNGAWVIARRDRGIEKPADLRGKRIATQADSAVHFFMSMFLREHRIGEDEAQVIYMKAVDLPGALVRGEIDAFSMRNPFIETAKQALGEQAVEFFAADLYRQTFNLVAKRALIGARRDALARIVKALVRAEELVTRDSRDAKSATAAAMGEGRMAEVEKDWDRYSYQVSLDQSLFITLEDQARWAMARRGLAPDAMPNFLEYVDVTVLDAVKPSAVTVIR